MGVKKSRSGSLKKWTRGICCYFQSYLVTCTWVGKCSKWALGFIFGDLPTEYDTVHPKLKKTSDVLPLKKQENINQRDVVLSGKLTVLPWHSLCVQAFSLETIEMHSAAFKCVSSYVHSRQSSLEGVLSALQVITWLHEQGRCRALSERLFSSPSLPQALCFFVIPKHMARHRQCKYLEGNLSNSF